MKLEEKEVTLKNGKAAIIKSPEKKDALQLINLVKQTSDETENMVRYSDEFNLTVGEEEKLIDNQNKEKGSIFISVFVEGKLAGNAGFSAKAPFERCRHRAEMGISVLKDYWGLGIGNYLVIEVIEAAKKANYEQIELDVVMDNEKAIKLYEKHGFKKCGVLPNAFKYRDGRYKDLNVMYLMLK